MEANEAVENVTKADILVTSTAGNETSPEIKGENLACPSILPLSQGTWARSPSRGRVSDAPPNTPQVTSSPKIEKMRRLIEEQEAEVERLRELKSKRDQLAAALTKLKQLALCDEEERTFDLDKDASELLAQVGEVASLQAAVGAGGCDAVLRAIHKEEEESPYRTIKKKIGCAAAKVKSKHPRQVSKEESGLTPEALRLLEEEREEQIRLKEFRKKAKLEKKEKIAKKQAKHQQRAQKAHDNADTSALEPVARATTLDDREEKAKAVVMEALELFVATFPQQNESPGRDGGCAPQWLVECEADNGGAPEEVEYADDFETGDDGS